eukprot:gene1978-15304_t
MRQRGGGGVRRRGVTRLLGAPPPLRLCGARAWRLAKLRVVDLSHNRLHALPPSLFAPRDAGGAATRAGGAAGAASRGAEPASPPNHRTINGDAAVTLR